jgi:hypothetical protein
LHPRRFRPFIGHKTVRHFEPVASLERCDDVIDLLAPARLLDLGDPAAATVGNSGLRDLVVRDGVVALDVSRSDDPTDIQDAHLVVHTDFLRAGDHHVPVGKPVDHDGRNREFNLL